MLQTATASTALARSARQRLHSSETSNPPSLPTTTTSPDVTTEEAGCSGDVILVTGGNGFVGQHVIKQLHESASHVREIRGLDLRTFTPNLGSVTDYDAVCDAMRDVTSVFHIAGLVSYGTFPDVTAMEKINVDGTLNVIRACLSHGVSRLLYCSTVDVVIGFEPIRGGRENDTPIPPKFLFPGYPRSKLQGERLVLAANEESCHNGNKLNTLSLRANVMYGELDPFYVTTALQNAKRTFGKLLRVGNGQARFQQCYVGNTAAAFVQADAALRENSALGGEVFFIPDDTPLQNSFQFIEPYLKSREYSLSCFYLPYKVVYGLLYLMELVLKALSPLVKIHMKNASCSVKYINMDLYFCAEKAHRMFNYTTVFSPSEARERSLSYYKSIKL